MRLGNADIKFGSSLFKSIYNISDFKVLKFFDIPTWSLYPFSFNLSDLGIPKSTFDQSKY